MAAARRKTIDEFLKELELRPGEKELLDRLSKWPKKDLAKWLMFHLLAKGGMASQIVHPKLVLPVLFAEYYPGLCEFANLIEGEINASQQSKSLAMLQN